MLPHRGRENAAEQAQCSRLGVLQHAASEIGPSEPVQKHGEMEALTKLQERFTFV
ncbi:hypothetical protein LUW74_32890 [Actinomadura madurae]|uniref:hypothetical protein n=1 Tax=Actinomadura madurae TaxID=1993 RepID=UPI0020267B95|nr:hypothetical protein [Actinomadura madurae]URN07684.1 hypothetical protein LUW74_32890 [Actinomadura madurae]